MYGKNSVYIRNISGILKAVKRTHTDESTLKQKLQHFIVGIL